MDAEMINCAGVQRTIRAQMIFQLIAAQSRRRISVPCSGGRALEIALINERLLNARNVISGEVLILIGRGVIRDSRGGER